MSPFLKPVPKEHFDIKAVECKFWGLKKMKEREQRKVENDFLNSDCGQFIFFFLSEKGSVLISPWNKMVLGKKKHMY